MKILKRLIAAVAAIALLSSCSVLKNITTSPTSAGSNTGSAILALYRVLSQTGAIDLSSVMNVLNIGKIRSVSAAMNGRFEAKLLNGEVVIISRQYVSAFKKKIGM